MGVLTGETPHWIGLGKKATVLVFCITEYGIWACLKYFLPEKVNWIKPCSLEWYWFSTLLIWNMSMSETTVNIFWQRECDCLWNFISLRSLQALWLKELKNLMKIALLLWWCFFLVGICGSVKFLARILLDSWIAWCVYNFILLENGLNIFYFIFPLQSIRDWVVCIYELNSIVRNTYSQ